MLRVAIAVVLMAFFTTACNTMDGLVTDVNHGVNKLKGDDDHH
jgi:predicted small secreted protein